MQSVLAQASGDVTGAEVGGSYVLGRHRAKTMRSRARSRVTKAGQGLEGVRTECPGWVRTSDGSILGDIKVSNFKD